MGSTRSRKISSHSLQSDAKLVEEDGTTTFEDAESVTMLSDETQESPVERDQEVEDEHLCDSLPWIKVSREWIPFFPVARGIVEVFTHRMILPPSCG